MKATNFFALLLFAILSAITLTSCGNDNDDDTIVEGGMEVRMGAVEDRVEGLEKKVDKVLEKMDHSEPNVSTATTMFNDGRRVNVDIDVLVPAPSKPIVRTIHTKETVVIKEECHQPHLPKEGWRIDPENGREYNMFVLYYHETGCKEWHLYKQCPYESRRPNLIWRSGPRW